MPAVDRHAQHPTTRTTLTIFAIGLYAEAQTASMALACRRYSDLFPLP